MRYEISKEFLDDVRMHWGDADRVARAGLDEMSRYMLAQGTAIELDQDAQVDLALRIGVLVGRNAEQSSEIFLREFEQHFANE